MVNIPDDLRAFLTDAANRWLEFAPGGEVEQVELFPPDQLSEDWFTFLGPADSSEDEPMDYVIRGIGLAKSCRAYQPAGIMVWFPSLGLYGSWDDDHHVIVVFPGVRWTDIVRRPEVYFNAAWCPNSVAHRYLQPADGTPANRPDPLADHPRLPGF